MPSTAPLPYLSSRRKRFSKKIEFTGAASLGAVGTVPVATISGAVLIEALTTRCTEDLVGATATLEMGVSGDTAGLIAQTTATDIDSGEFWTDASPEAGVGTPITNKTIDQNIILTVGTAAITDGTLWIDIFYYPLFNDGSLS